jgi:hypothetical protein
MNILGISAHYHDSAAALVVDGVPVCAIQEERLSRHKGDAAFPLLAIESCLQHAEIEPDELDAVVFYERPMLKFDRILTCALMWSTRQGFCTTHQTRVRLSHAWCALHARAGLLFSGSTTYSHAFLSGPGASSLGCLDTDSSRVIRCCATDGPSQRGAKPGCGTNINIPRSTVTPWPRSQLGPSPRRTEIRPWDR